MPPRRKAGALAIVMGIAAFLCQLSGSAGAAFPGRNGLIAFRSNRQYGGFSLWVAPPGGGQVKKLNAPGWSARWSPTGRRLVAIGQVPGGGEIYLVNADGR